MYQRYQNVSILTLHYKSIKMPSSRKMDKELSEDNSEKKYNWLINIRKNLNLLVIKEMHM